MKSKRIRNLIPIFLCAAFLIVLFNRSLIYPKGEMGLRHILVLIISFFGTMVLPPLLVFVKPFADYTERFFDGLRAGLSALRKNPGRVLKVLLAVVLCVLAAFLFEKLILSGGGSFNLCRFYFCAGSFLILLTLFFFRRSAFQKVELLFLLVAGLAGSAFILSSPRHIGVTWDDETHYARVISLSGFFDHSKYEADGRMILDNEYFVFGQMDGTLEYEEVLRYYEDIDALYQTKRINDEEITYQAFYGVFSPCYIPQAVFIIIGKGLGLSYDRIFMLGKFGGFLLYLLLFYFSIRRLKSGKLLMAACALTPTVFLQACSYSADGWLVSWTCAGFAIFISELQEPERKLKTGTAVLMVACFLLGSLPKQIYFVLMFAPLFLPAKKFTSRKQRALYIGLILSASILLILSFVLPMFFSSSNVGDVRGEGEVNATLQIRHILSDPWSYAVLLAKFLRDYLSPDNAQGYLTNFGYFGQGRYYVLMLCILAVLAFLDREEVRRPMPLVKAAFYFSAFGMAVLVATAMYVTFTAVDFFTVLGCQPRYLLPAVFPTLYFLGVDGIKFRADRSHLALAAVGLPAAIFLLIYLEQYVAVI